MDEKQTLNLGICQECGKQYTIPEGNWLKTGEVGKARGSVSGERFCCFECGQKYSQKKRKSKWVSPFSTPEVRQKAKESIQAKYGVGNYFASNESKERLKTYYKEKYGIENPSQVKEIRDKTKETQIKRYGGIGCGSESVNQKIKATNIKKYGTPYPQSLNTIKEKIKRTNLKRRGVTAPMMSEEVKNKSKESCNRLYGYDWNCLGEKARKASGSWSKTNDYWAEKFRELGYGVEQEKVIDGRVSFDLYIPEKNTLIDINPTHSHQSSIDMPHFNGHIPPKAKTYHREKMEIAKKLGYECFMIWDWDNEERVLNYFRKKEEIRLKECEIREIDTKTANNFLNIWHLQGVCNNVKVAIGLFKGDLLVSVMTFGPGRLNKKMEYEWLRYASCKIVHRAVSKMFQYFLDTYHPQSIVSYCDYSKFDGKMFGHMGFKAKRTTPYPSCHYSKGNQHWTLNEVNLIGACRLLSIPQIPKSSGKNNRDIMLENGFLEVFDCGQATYRWTTQK